MRHVVKLAVLSIILTPKFGEAYCVNYFPKSNLKPKFKVFVKNSYSDNIASHEYTQTNSQCWNKQHLKSGGSYMELTLVVKEPKLVKERSNFGGRYDGERYNKSVSKIRYSPGKTTAAGNMHRQVEIKLRADGYAEIYPKSDKKLAVNVYYTPDVKTPKTYYVEF